MKISKYNKLGKGWHSDSIRHSNARKTGFAGGVYAKKNIGKNLRMDDKLYLLRRKIINNLYDARKLVGSKLPYITVRITSFNDTNPMGMASIHNNQIWISEDMKNWSDNQLKYIVFHELAHTYFHIKGHRNDVKLMRPAYSPDLSEKEIEEDFVKLSKEKNLYAKSDIVSELNNKEIVVEKVKPKEFSELPIVKMKEDEGYSVDAVSDIHNNPKKIEIKIKDSGNDEKNAMLLAHEFNEIEKFKKINKNGYKQGSEELAHQQNKIKYDNIDSGEEKVDSHNYYDW